LKRDFISLTDFTTSELFSLIDLADSMHRAWHSHKLPQTLTNRAFALIWDAGGFRNRVAFELGIQALGGRAVQVPGRLDQRESIEDISRYLQNWFDCIIARTETHEQMLRLSAAADIPVINARTSHNHPCEILSDLTYIRKHRGTLDGLTVVFVGEPTNLCYPWFEAAARLPIKVIQACPKGYETSSDYLGMLRRSAVGYLSVTNDLREALPEAEVVYTDCWPKGKTAEEQLHIRNAFLPYQITTEMLSHAKSGCYFLPCPPVTRGEEVSSEVMGTSGSVVYKAKEYLLHAQNAVLTFLVTGQ
jgi:ornithine carbamoyltransferase